MPRDAGLVEALDVLDQRLDRSGGDVGDAYHRLSRTEVEFIEGEIERCLADPQYFIKNYYWIKSKEQGVILFDSWWESQDILYAAMMHERARRGLIKLAVLKARQLGSSEFCTAMVFWKGLFTPGCNALIMAQDEEQSDFIFSKCRLAYDSLPWWMRPEVRYERKGHILEFDRRDAEARRANPGLRSAFYVDAATKSTGVAVGKGLKAALLSELCWYPDAGVLLDQIFPTLEGVEDQLSIMESTSMGEQQMWFDTYLACVDRDLDWRPLFIEAYRIKKYSIPLPPGQALQLSKEETAIKERVLREKGVELSDGYLNWRRVKMREFEKMGRPEAFFRQYPGTTWVEAFTMAGDCAFDRRKLQFMMEVQERAPKWAGEIALRSVGGRLTYKLMGSPMDPSQTPQSWKLVGQRFRMWEDPDPEEHYYVSVDPALGIAGRDATAIQVVKIGRLHEPDEQVACWHGYESPTPTAAIAYAIGCLYASEGQEAQIAVEIDGVGKACSEELYKRLEYPNPYRWQVSDKIRNAMTNFLGWQTTSRTRDILITRMREQVQTDGIIVHDRDTLLELKAFASEGGGRFEGRGRRDDLAMSLMVGTYCAHQSDYGQRAAASVRRTNATPGRYVQTLRGMCATSRHSVTWLDGDSFDPDWAPGVRILIGKQWCQIESVPGRQQLTVPIRAIVDGHWVTLPPPDDDGGVGQGSITVREFLPEQERVEWVCVARRRDFHNTDFSPIHDKPGSPEARLYNEHHVPAEYVRQVLDHAGAPPEFVGDMEAHAGGGSEADEDAWMRY